MVYFYTEKWTTLLLFGSKWGEASNIVGAWGLMMMCSVIFYSFPAELYKSKGIPQMLFLSQCIYLLFMIPICVVTAKLGFWIMVYSRCGAIIIQMIIGIVFMKKFFEIDLQDYFKSFLYPLIATIAMILISEVTKWYLKGIIGDFIGILVCVLVYLAVVYVVARKQLLNIIQTIKKKKYNNIETLLVRTKIYSYFKEDISSINNAQEAFSLPGHSVVSANINYLLLDKMK